MSKHPALKTLDFFLWVGAFGLLGAFVIGDFGHLHWVADLFAHFPMYYFIFAGVLVTFFLLRREMIGLLIAGLVCAVQVPTLAPYWLGTNQTSDTSYDEVRLLQFNIAMHNQPKQQLVDWIAQKADSVDVVTLFEVTPAWAVLLDPLKQLFPHYKIHPQNDPGGIALFSKLAPRQLELFAPEPTKPVALLRTKTSTQAIPFTLFAVHPPPPVSQARWETRNRLLDKVADLVAKEKTNHVVLTGDFNVTPFSPWFEQIIEKSTLRDSNPGHGYNGTWPAMLPETFRLPIDLVLVSEDIVVSEKYFGPNFGSDHFPVITIMQLPVKGKSNA